MGKESIQKNLDRAKARIRQAESDGHLSQESKAIIELLLSLVEIMMAIALQKRTRKNSNNSGLPPSQDIGGRHNDRGDGKGGRGDQKIGRRLDNARIQEQSHVLSPEKCRKCGADITDVSATATEERKTIDIEYVIKKEAYTAETKKCPGCGEKSKAGFPGGIDGPIQYGIGIKASVVNFLLVQMMSLQRVQEHFKGLLGRFISQAAMLKYIVQLHASLEEWESGAVAELLEARVLYVDETSMRVDKKNYWVHTYGFEDIVLQFCHPKRGRGAMEEIGIIVDYGGIVVHDRYNSYFTYGQVLHALCAAHLLRDLKFVEEAEAGSGWATRMKKLLKVAIKMVGKRKAKVLSAREYEKLRRLYGTILSDALSELPVFPRPDSRGGKTKLTDGQNLWETFLCHGDSILLFAKVAEVDATNNRAERDLRMCKVKKKVSGCFRNPEFAKYFCRISSYVKTMRNKGYSSLQAIALALKGEIPPP